MPIRTSPRPTRPLPKEESHAPDQRSDPGGYRGRQDREFDRQALRHVARDDGALQPEGVAQVLRGFQHYPGFQNEDLFDFGERFSMDDGAELGELNALNIKTTA